MLHIHTHTHAHTFTHTHSPTHYTGRQETTIDTIGSETSRIDRQAVGNLAKGH